ncbi:peptide chain release factor N(5)-glutamine methyltransferase [Ancylomarina longa]|uniref:Release factor glutamine methyltransferase n=1 Tax=Ancylomarina longa TaxID=2487017 RepID=A0A434AGJ3_9BACT|nr:peptide chain release factor N(5)-glutamine methyltransferase [Ancylomarina longa]RUT73512.1 peptide chain release factor N(5)-glutamine methyltransferase [Ancylomarina longa]
MNSENSIQSTINYIKKELQNTYSLREIESISYILLEHILKYSRIEIHIRKQEIIEQNLIEEIHACVKELKDHKPIQYVLGETEFYDLRFKVNRHTLIPRPETEELVHAIVTENKADNLNVMDIGTGSGCIPISLAKNLNQANVFTTDISTEAIVVAKENAQINDAVVTFYHRDILNWKDFEWENFDIIVSNPPYVKESEKAKMENNVLEYEPHLALFVTDHDPLIFYRTIADFALVHLNKGGKLYFEINESLGKEMTALLHAKGFSSILVRKDINGRNRMMTATIPE